MVESVVHRNTKTLICDELEDNMCVARRKSSCVSKRTNFYGRPTTSSERLTNDHKVRRRRQTLFYSHSIQSNSVLVRRRQVRVKRPHDSATYREVLSNEYNRSMHAPHLQWRARCVGALCVCGSCMYVCCVRVHSSIVVISLFLLSHTHAVLPQCLCESDCAEGCLNRVMRIECPATRETYRTLTPHPRPSNPL
jgi:hypothetical protein